MILKTKINNASAEELIKSKGYEVEEHYVTTSDGYILTMQRIPFSHEESQDLDEINNAYCGVTNKPVVFILHGFMQNSEVWLSKPNKEDCLPLELADRGYDVWLGNVRGNKYSKKHIKMNSNTNEFWDFCMDELIQYDIPTMIEYVLENTEQESLSYIGFSQGSALGFGAFSLHHNLAKKINIFIALASTAKIQGLKNILCDAIARSKPKLVFYMFGRQSFLSSTLFWRKLLPKIIFSKIIDVSNYFLFGWKSQNIPEDEKPMLYSHLYSTASVKSVVHWFQLITTSRFQMFDDTLNHTDTYSNVVPAYHINRIPAPIAVFFGQNDPLPDMEALLEILPNGTKSFEKEGYEHLDFLWAKDIHENVFVDIFGLLKDHQNTPNKQDENNSDEEDDNQLNEEQEIDLN